MSDNMIGFQKEKDSKGLARKILSISLLALIVIGALAMILFPGELNLDAARRWFRYMNVRQESDYGEYSYDAHNSNQYAVLDDGLALASVGGISCFSAEGTELYVSQAQMSIPLLMTADELAMSYDVAGNTLLLVHRDNGELLRLDTPAAIYDADLAQDGSLCYVSSDSSHKSVISIYDQHQNMVYRWLSATVYLPVCAVSENANRFAAIGLGQTDGTFESSLYLFDTAIEGPSLVTGLGNDLIYDLTFCSDQVLCAVGETSSVFVNTEGKIVGNFSYEGQYLEDYDLGGNGFLTLLLNMYRAGNRSTLVTADKNGKQLGSVYIGQEVLDISSCGRYIAVLTGDGLTVYNEKLQVYSKTNETANATSVVMRDDGTVLLLGNGAGKLYIP